MRGTITDSHLCRCRKSVIYIELTLFYLGTCRQLNFIQLGIDDVLPY